MDKLLDIYFPLLLAYPFTVGSMILWGLSVLVIIMVYYRYYLAKSHRRIMYTNFLLDILGLYNAGLILGLLLVLSNEGVLKAIVGLFVQHSLGTTCIFPAIGNIYVLLILKGLREDHDITKIGRPNRK